MSRPAELDDRDRRGLTALPFSQWRCLVCGHAYLASNLEDCDCVKTSIPETPVTRPSTLRALAVWLRFALLTLAALVGVVLAAYAIHGAATWE